MDAFLLLAGLVALVLISLRLTDRGRFDAPDPLKEKRAERSPARPDVRPVPGRKPTPESPQQTVLTGAAYVIDGDSLLIQKRDIRLFGVDAPEFDHPFGKKAKWALVKLVKGQKIRAVIHATDDHGRLVAQCFLPDGRDLSAEMVKQGLALDWPKFSGGIYAHLEVPNARKRLWLADARQKGRMHLWRQYEARKAAEEAES